MTDESRMDIGSDDCIIPTAVQPEALEKYLLKREPFDGSDEIRSYVESQAPDEKVTYLERVASERVIARDHDIWDVHTTGERYWVITNPTNLYSQRLFPSADYTLSFHVGLMARVLTRRDTRVSDESMELLPGAWRRWEQAGKALDRAHEADEFQAVGMRCRECLLTLVRELADDSIVPPGDDAPQLANFLEWSQLIANALAHGSSNSRVRGHLRSLSASGWELANWLTHARGAVRADAELVHHATHAVLVSFTIVMVRRDQGTATACPGCGSYRLIARSVSDGDAVSEVVLCVACGWQDIDAG